MPSWDMDIAVVIFSADEEIRTDWLVIKTFSVVLDNIPWMDHLWDF